MKLIMTLSIMLMTTAVFAQQKRTVRAENQALSSVVVKMKSKESGPIKGIVRMTDRKCGLNIEVRSKDGVKMYHPINLPEDYKVDGKIIVFNYSAFDSGNIVKCEVENRIKVSNVKPAQRFPVKL